MNKEEYRSQLKEWLSTIQHVWQDDNIHRKVEHLRLKMEDDDSSEQEWYELAERIAEDMQRSTRRSARCSKWKSSVTTTALSV